MAHFYNEGHRLRVTKSYVQGVEIRDLVRRAMAEGSAPFKYLDRFDVITDAFDVVRV
ncbi:unnamed protein product, partial [Polarella glacialis]